MSKNYDMPSYSQGQSPYSYTPSTAGPYPTGTQPGYQAGLSGYQTGVPGFPAGMPGYQAGYPATGYPGGYPPTIPASFPGGGVFPGEESYIENILRLNRGKLATVYMTFENNQQWNAKIFKGVIEAAGKDHLVLSDPQTGKRYLLLMIYLDYVVFDEELDYAYPYAQRNEKE
ncbi:spore germination protein Q [Melghiribacillus thermohalophilus]|uniref:Spore germination protein Q n=1 Tax=Melghiribacillus thermohalophilus TaxID=1324956 RepID=A0A4R3NBY8_9BACI|nr:spore coat protein GerQ [Melghiribacillus thermohalophilus]TCT26338.1 spore germination protein Q [Melghiribacillus thermohalophilus]